MLLCIHLLKHHCILQFSAVILDFSPSHKLLYKVTMIIHAHPVLYILYLVNLLHIIIYQVNSFSTCVLYSDSEEEAFIGLCFFGQLWLQGYGQSLTFVFAFRPWSP